MSKTSKSPTTTNPMDPALMRRAPTHPGEIFKLDFREPMKLSQAEAARRLEMPLNRLNEFEKGKRGVTADSALRLAMLTGTSPQLWMNLQSNLELYHAYQKLKASGVLRQVEKNTAVTKAS
jgi:addiction module HigA family antidote